MKQLRFLLSHSVKFLGVRMNEVKSEQLFSKRKPTITRGKNDVWLVESMQAGKCFGPFLFSIILQMVFVAIHIKKVATNLTCYVICLIIIQYHWDDTEGSERQ